MLKEALEYVVGLKKPEIVALDNEVYSDKPLQRIDYDPVPESLQTRTLTSIIDYINQDVDYIRGNKLMLQVVSPVKVKVKDFLNRNMVRSTYISAEAEVPDIPFGRYIPLEEFKILLASCFEDSKTFGCDNDKEILLSFVSHVQVGTVADYGDDGISQKAVVSRGITNKEEVLVPNPVSLCPYRSFHEIPQTKSEFIFRLKDEGGQISCALFEADGGAWRNTARMEIAEYLQKEIMDDEEKRFHVLF